LQPAPDFLGKFDMIVSNPPYITSKEMTLLDASVKDYEPHLALHGGEDGLDFYRSIATNYKACLKKGGYLCLEYDPSQGDDICKILEENGFTVLERVQDFNDRERALLAQWKED
jgi:release factor glutamine methyltransferase